MLLLLVLLLVLQLYAALVKFRVAGPPKTRRKSRKCLRNNKDINLYSEVTVSETPWSVTFACLTTGEINFHTAFWCKHECRNGYGSATSGSSEKSWMRGMLLLCEAPKLILLLSWAVSPGYNRYVGTSPMVGHVWHIIPRRVQFLLFSSEGSFHSLFWNR